MLYVGKERELVEAHHEVNGSDILVHQDKGFLASSQQLMKPLIYGQMDPVTC
jgi:hypothetical protein